MDPLDVTPEGALQQVSERLASDRLRGNPPPDKTLILLLWDDSPAVHDYTFYNAGMSFTQMISLCEIHKFHCLQQLYTESSGDEPEKS